MSKLCDLEQITKSLKDCVGICTDEEIREKWRLNLELIFSIQIPRRFWKESSSGQTEFAFATKCFSSYLLQQPGRSLSWWQPDPVRPAEGKKRGVGLVLFS